MPGIFLFQEEEKAASMQRMEHAADGASLSRPTALSRSTYQHLAPNLVFLPQIYIVPADITYRLNRQKSLPLRFPHLYQGIVLQRESPIAQCLLSEHYLERKTQ